MTESDEQKSIRADFHDAVNMTASALEKWLDTDESKAVGDKSDGGESTGHHSGRRIVEILGTRKDDLTPSQVDWMRKVVGYVKRHTAQRPDGDIEHTPWRYSLMNWGHDPLK